MQIISLFSGIGAFEKAFDNLGIPYELIGFSEIDKYAINSYCAIHDVDKSVNFGDITKVDEKTLPKYVDLITYGFPCQDISNAGKQKGLLHCDICNTPNDIPENFAQRLKDGEKFYCSTCGAELKQTRSGLFFEALRIIEETQPRVAIAENVKNLTGKKFKEQFRIVLESLEAAGYNNYWAVLNLKDYGLPQNRERVFIVSIHKHVDNKQFKFPDGFPLELRLKDLLEDEVDEKYFLSDKMLEKAILNLENAGKKFIDIIGHSGTGGQKGWIHSIEGGVGALSASDYKQPKQIAVKQICNLMPSATRENPNQGRLYDKEGLAPTLGAMQGGNRQPFIIVGDNSLFIREATKTGYAEANEGDTINLEHPNSKTRRGRVGKQVAQTLTTSPQQAVVVGDIKMSAALDEQNGYIRKDGCVGTITTDGSSPKHNNRVIQEDLQIRKLTPRECFRLMGFSDVDFEKAQAVNSDTQLYKQAGNSIGVPVVEYIIKALLECGALK